MSILPSIETEFRRYKALAEAAMNQLEDEQLHEHEAGNSVSTIAWHVGGNLASRFTDFLTTDGEKDWRNREEEFVARTPPREELLRHWQRGWSILFDALSNLEESDLAKHVTIRGVELTVPESLHRSLAHVSYHVGQMVYRARLLRGSDWKYLSIPPGQSDSYNREPNLEHGSDHASSLDEESRDEP